MPQSERVVKPYHLFSVSGQDSPLGALGHLSPLGGSTSSSSSYSSSPRGRFSAYYLYVPLVLFAQGIVCYIPQLVWKSVEGGIIHGITSGRHCESICAREWHVNPVFFSNPAKISTTLSRSNRAKIQAEFHDAMRSVLLFRFVVYLMLEVANLASIVLQVGHMCWRQNMCHLSHFRSGFSTSFFTTPSPAAVWKLQHGCSLILPIETTPWVSSFRGTKNKYRS